MYFSTKDVTKSIVMLLNILHLIHVILIHIMLNVLHLITKYICCLKTVTNKLVLF